MFGLGLAVLGCGDPEARKVTDRFLEALKRSDYPAAYAELHSDARTLVPNDQALKSLIEKKGSVITGWSRNCSSSGKGVDRGGYNFSANDRSMFQERERVTVGVEPKIVGKCTGPLLIELHQEGGAWKIRSFRF
jgi:hypothetical protein